MKLMKLLPVVLLAVTTSAFAHSGSHVDAAEAYDSTTKTRSVNYVCQSGKKVTVKYGFNSNNLPTYAEATLNGKKRSMPVNTNSSDQSQSIFGDENNFRLSANAITYQNVRKSSMNIQSAGNQMLFKGCKAK